MNNEITEPQQINLNVPLLRKTVEWAESQWELEQKGQFSEWFQQAWVCFPSHAQNTCGTAYCMAGYIGQMNNPAFVRADAIQPNLLSEIDLTLYPAFEALKQRMADYPGYEIHVADYAAILLGFEGYTHMEEVCDAHGIRDLFSGGNGIHEVREIAVAMAKTFAHETL